MIGFFTQIFPGKLLEPTYPDPDNQENLLARSEVERRQTYIDQLDRKLPEYGHHPIAQLVKECLKNAAAQRPTTEDVLKSLEEMKPAIDDLCGEVARADAVRQVVMMRTILGRETEVRRKTDELAAKDEEIHHLQQELEQEQVGKYIISVNDSLKYMIMYNITCHSFRLSELGLRNNFNILMQSFIN